MLNAKIVAPVEANVTGNLTGNVLGDVQGSVFADNSTIMLDGVNRTLDVITATADIVSTPLLKVDNIVSDSPSNNNIKIENPENAGNFTLEVDSTDGYTTIELGKVSAGDLTGDGGSYGKLNFTRRDTNGTVITSQIWGGGSGGGIYLSSDSNGLPSASGSAITATWEEGKLGLGTFTPQHTLDVRGEGVFTGDVTASAFKGTFAIDDSSIVIDGTTGGLIVANIDVIGETGNTPATPGAVDSWLEISVNGATKYIPLYD